MGLTKNYQTKESCSNNVTEISSKWLFLCTAMHKTNLKMYSHNAFTEKNISFLLIVLEVQNKTFSSKISCNYILPFAHIKA